MKLIYSMVYKTCKINFKKIGQNDNFFNSYLQKKNQLFSHLI